MSELVPCPACKRHVTTREITCPFCTRALPPLRAQRANVIGRVTRAAVFSAALAACSSDKPKQEPPPAKGSDDLEKLLDEKPEKVEHPDVTPPVDAEAIAQTGDAAVTPDAGVDEAAKKLAEQKRLAEKKKREAERREAERQRREQEDLNRLRNDQMQNAKPYGAPPARRRIV